MKSVEIVVTMTINVDGAPNAYGPDNRKALDFELNAHVGARKDGRIVGYLTKADKITPLLQERSLGDPCPGFYISTTAYTDKNNRRETDPRRYVNAAEINYTLLGKVASEGGVKLGDFCVVHSKRSRNTVFAIVGDAGNSSGAEGSLALLQRLGYPFTGGKAGKVENKEIVVRYFPGSNPERVFFTNQADLEAVAGTLNLDTEFSHHHADRDSGNMVFDSISSTAHTQVIPRVEPFAPVKGEPPAYPGQVIKLNSDEMIAVGIVQKRLRDLGYTETAADGSQPLSVDGVYDVGTFEAVQLFQVRHTDLEGSPLEADGEVGSDTWGALFGRQTVHASPEHSTDGLLVKVMDFAASEIGVREKPTGTNRGERVEEYQRSVGISAGDPWCVAFVYFCFEQAAAELGVANPLKAKCRTGGVLDLWARARTASIPTLVRDAALNDPSRVEPGMIFIVGTGGGLGHTGLVESVRGNKLVTIEGNTNDNGSREGIGVFRRSGRSIASINRGFISFQR